MNRRFSAALACFGWWGPQTSAAIRDRAAQLEIENKALREHHARLAAENAQLLQIIGQFRFANQNLYAQLNALGESQATRNLAARDHLLNELADTWRFAGIERASVRVH